MASWSRGLLVASLGCTLGLVLGCSSRSVGDDGMGGDGSTSEMAPDELEPGVQPPGPGTMYSPCERSAQCPPLEFCVFPQGEAGFCTDACASPTNPGNCEPPPGDQDPTCFDIGLSDGRFVCALDCSVAPCPRGMRCVDVESGGGARSICF